MLEATFPHFPCLVLTGLLPPIKTMARFRPILPRISRLRNRKSSTLMARPCPAAPNISHPMARPRRAGELATCRSTFTTSNPSGGSQRRSLCWRLFASFSAPHSQVSRTARGQAWSLIRVFFQGANHPVCLAVWVQWWAADNERRPNDRLGYWLGIYAMLGGVAIVCLFIGCW